MSAELYGTSIRHNIEQKAQKYKDIVFDKFIFVNVFYKDIRRAYIYKKAERLASALYLITPAFHDSLILKTKVERLAVRLTETASLSPSGLREGLSRELLELSSLLSIARTGSFLSPMNVDIIALEVRSLLAEVAEYEEPRIALAAHAALPRHAPAAPRARRERRELPSAQKDRAGIQGHLSDRQEAILSFIGAKEPVYLKDIARVVQGVSDKTIQRELSLLIEAGKVEKRGERRWSTYALAGA